MWKCYKTKGKGVIGKDHRTKTITRAKFERVKKMFPAFKSWHGKVVYYDSKNNMMYCEEKDPHQGSIFVRVNFNKHPEGYKNFIDSLYGLTSGEKPTKLQRSINQYRAAKSGGSITMAEAHNMLEEGTPVEQDTSGAIKSDGGKSDYYKIVLPQWLLDKHAEKGFIMLEDLAEIMYGNDFNFTNVFKAQKRMFELKNGRGKEGNTFEYDANKVKYYVDKQVEVFNR